MPALTDLTVKKPPSGTAFRRPSDLFRHPCREDKKTWVVIKGKNRTKVSLGHYPVVVAPRRAPKGAHRAREPGRAR